jgi:hypothetical protein
MDPISILQVDERDSHWEDWGPRFRVYLHGRPQHDGSAGGWTDNYDITGADVIQVIDWAQKQAAGELTYSIALVVDDDDEEGRNPGQGRGLVWLLGQDGNMNFDPGSSLADAQARMLVRKREPIGVPPRDLMPAGLPDPYNDGTQTR